MIKLEQRINIIFNLKVTFGYTKGDLKKRIKNIKISLFIFTLFPLFGLCITLIAIFSNFNLIESDLWSRSAQSILMSIVFSLSLPYLYYQYILFRHIDKIKNIKNKNPHSLDILNKSLETNINKINNRLKDLWQVFTLALIVIAMTVWQTLGDNANPYWNNTAYLVLLFFLFYFIKTYSTYKKLKRNIDKTEKLVLD